MKIGKLYQANKYFWFLYPSKDSAAASDGPAHAARHASGADTIAAIYSKRCNCNVSYVFPNSIFCCLEQDEEYIKILTINGEAGWIRASKWELFDIEEVNQ
jgi:hypothetical protein